MARIRVTPESLIGHSGQINAAAPAIQGVGNTLVGVASRGPGYDVQFGNAICAIGKVIQLYQRNPKGAENYD